MSNSNLTVLSVIFFVAGLCLYKKTNPSKVSMGLFYFMTFSSMFLFIAYGVADYFTGQGIDEATIYHLKYGLDGAGFLEYSWLIVAAISAIILSAIYLFWLISKSKNNIKQSTINSLSYYFLLSFSLLLNPASINIYNYQANSIISTEQLNPQASTSFYGYYRKPYIKKLKKYQKNIVFIYAESLERTYFDETLFPGLIRGLRELELESTYFTNIKQLNGTGWTVGGMTASQCGIPLFTPSHRNSMSGMDQFLSSAVCLGDLLSSKGYYLNYMGGASLDFAGKGKLFETHGFTNVLGRDELLPKLDNEAYKTAWGLYDDSLFDLVYRRFVELSETNEKFGLFMLTLDTHHPNGHPSKSCINIKYTDDSNPILNAVACSDYLITGFIKKIVQSPYADNTVVVLVSDHLALKNTAYDLLQKKDRRNLFMIIDPSTNNSAEIQTAGSTLDIGATLLSFVGYTGNIGLGRNLLDETEPEEDRIFIHANLTKWKKPISEFWDFPRIQDSMEININEKIVHIDNRNFQMPILIELNSKLESTLRFQFNNSPEHKTLVHHRKALGENKYFLLIDECINVRELDKTLSKNGLCLLAGQGKKYTKIVKLDKIITYTVNEIRQLINLSNELVSPILR